MSAVAAATPPASGRNLVSWLYASPLVIVLIPFFVAPIFVVIVASFLENDAFGGMLPHFTLGNYVAIFSHELTWRLYLSTVKFAVITWAATLVLGFWIAYFLVFHVRNPLLAIGLFLLCTVPFWTSNIIRMISWIPLLGKNGLINSVLISVGAIHQPLEFLLFSDFAVVVAYVHQLTIFMIVPIFNAMARIDKRTIEAARDAGASRFEIMRFIVVPLSKNGIALGSIFVLSIVMGDFFVVKVMSGGGSASIVSALFEDIAVLQYPPAAANAVVLLLVVVLMISLILRTVDVRKEIAR
ncbi:MAG TPA: ABC transporter permease [Burkholderiales bacterium]|nr:ABC transporter permease [Burkholderiales bacterium]